MLGNVVNRIRSPSGGEMDDEREGLLNQFLLAKEQMYREDGRGVEDGEAEEAAD